MTVDSVEVFRQFAFWRHGTRLASFCIVPENCIFWGASFKLMKTLASLVPKKLQGFCETLLYHYTLMTRNSHGNTKQNPRWWKLMSLFKWAVWKENLWWTSRISFCIPMTIWSLIFLGTGSIEMMIRVLGSGQEPLILHHVGHGPSPPPTNQIYSRFWCASSLFLTPVAGPIFDHFPKQIFLNLISRTTISPDFDSFFK